MQSIATANCSAWGEAAAFLGFFKGMLHIIVSVMSHSNPLREAWLIAVCPSSAESAASDAAHVA
jgi:hypothetical protein